MKRKTTKYFRERFLLLLFALLLVTLLSSVCLAQPSLPKKEIPKDLPEEMQDLIVALYNKDPVERANSAAALRYRFREDLKPVLPVLLSMLHDNATLYWTTPFSPNTTATSPGEEAAKAIGAFGEEAVLPLLAKLTDKNPHVRKCAAAGLGETMSEAALDPLIALAEKEPNADVTAKAIAAIGYIPGAKGNDTLIAALKNKDWYVRENAARALEIRKDPRAIEPLTQLFREARAQDRGAFLDASRALDAIAGREHMDAVLYDDLVAGLRSRNWKACDDAASDLWHRKVTRAVGPLLQMLKEARSEKREMSITWAERALENNTGIAGPNKDKEWLQWWEEHK